MINVCFRTLKLRTDGQTDRREIDLNSGACILRNARYSYGYMDYLIFCYID